MFLQLPLLVVIVVVFFVFFGCFFGVRMQFFELRAVCLLKRKRGPKAANKFDSELDIAILSDKGLWNIVEKAGMSYPKDTPRPELVRALRSAGLDPRAPELEGSEERSKKLESLADTVKELKATVNQLANQMDSILALVSSPKPPLPLEYIQADISKLATAVAEMRTDCYDKPHTAAAMCTDRHAISGPTNGSGPYVISHAVASYASKARSSGTGSGPPAEDASRWSIVREKRKTASTTKSVGLVSAKPLKRAVFFIGGIDLTCNVQDLVSHCKGKNVSVTACNVFPSKRYYGTLAARLSAVDDEHAGLVLQPGFWPEGITARPWRFDNQVHVSAESLSNNFPQ